MPVIARFEGIVVKMYFRQSEHNPPHFHCFYGELVAVVSISDQTLLEGNFPKKQLKVIQKWAKAHKKELMDIWNTQVFQYIQ